MIPIKPLIREFIVKENGKEIRLPDPRKAWNVEAVKNFYASQYPALTTATVNQPIITDHSIEYHFNGTLGTKG